MIKTFLCYKNDQKTSDKQPDYRLTAKVGDKWRDIGAGWIKEGEKGKYIAFSLADAYGDKTGIALIELEAGQQPEMTAPEMERPEGEIPF